MQDNNHFPITWLEQSMLDVIVQNIHFVSSDRREAKTWVGRGWGRKQLSIKVHHQVNPKAIASFLADLNRVRGNANKVHSFPFCLATQYVKSRLLPARSTMLSGLSLLQMCHQRQSPGT